MAEQSASPLAGKRVAITRAVAQTSELVQQLTARGAVPILLPLISFAPPDDFAPLDSALRHLEQFDWLLFTSPNAVQAVVTRSKALGRVLASPNKRLSIAVVGPGTRHEVEKTGFSVDYVARTHLGVALAEELGEARLRRKSVLLPRSDRANPDLPAALRSLGVNVTEVVAYQTLGPDESSRNCVTQVVGGDADAILFFSPSAVHHFAELAGRDQLSILQHKLAIAALGPVTAAALRESGVQRIVLAADTTTGAVLDALEQHFAVAQQRSAVGAKRE